MSKNLYRINKKSDLDEIMKNNFLKPICIIFVSKTMDKKLYDDVAITLKSLSKQLTYSMILIVDFDDFVDNLNFFSQIKETVPSMISYFKAKQIAICNEKDNFIPQMVSTMDQIHSSYVGKLMNAFNQSSTQPNNSSNQKNQTNDEQNNQTLNKSHDQDNNIKERINTQHTDQGKKQKQDEDQNEEQLEEDEEQEEEDEEQEEEDKDEEQVEEQDGEQDDEQDDEQDEQSKNKLSKNKLTSDIVKKETDDNTTEEIRLKKEKLKEIKRLKEMLNKGV
jgi:flagellar biosynthesis GTPase FlhF